LNYLIDNLVGGFLWGKFPIQQLCNALAALLVGLPLWWYTWRPVQAEARSAGSAGDHARRSVIRKTYLYLALFAMVIGAMLSGGWLVYQVLSHALGSSNPYNVADTYHWLQTCLLFLLWLLYYIATLRGDNRLSERSLAGLHAAFQVLIFEPGEGSFSQMLIGALRRSAPDISARVIAVAEGGIADAGIDPHAVVLPSCLAVRPPEELRAWLENFGGKRIILPEMDADTVWLGAPGLSRAELARQAALALRQLAEGQPVRVAPPANAWMVIGYVLGGIFGLELLALLVALVSANIAGR
jgi:hypothetical protein